MDKEKRDSLYKQTMEEMKAEYEAIDKEYEQLRTRRFLLNRTISGIKHLLEKPEECTFHLLTEEEQMLKRKSK